MGKKSNLIIDIIAAVFKLTVSVALIVFALIVGVIKVLFFAFKPRGNIKSSRKKTPDQRGKTLSTPVKLAKNHLIIILPRSVFHQNQPGNSFAIQAKLTNRPRITIIPH